MFNTSTQRRYWMFANEEGIIATKRQVHDDFIALHGEKRGRGVDFLSFEEAIALQSFFERKLVEFCTRFKPPMPKGVQGTALQYFKRFYMNNSVMDYHPKEILVTAAYLACKVEEFNVSIEKFIENINGNKERAMEIVLNNELLLMKELNFHLTIHNAYRPLEGLLIDIKVRCQTLKNPEALRKDIEIFLDEIGFTNAAFVYAPSQIALAAIIHAASKNGENIDTYVTSALFGNVEQDKLKNIVDAVRNIRIMLKNGIPPLLDNASCKKILEKLDRCRNQDNNPDSQAYKRKLQNCLDDEDEPGAKLMRTDN